MATRNVALKVQLLGGVAAATPGGEKSFSADKRHQLLGYLACYRDWVSRDRLADLFWGDTTTETARQNLRKLLARTQALPWLTGLEVERQRVRWHVETDLAEFWRALEADDLERAVTLYQGSLLRGMDSYEDGGFADWLEVERGRAHSRWREALLRHAAGERPEKAASLYLRLLEQDEFDEEALARHLAALAQSGRKQDALKAYRAFAANLERELGLVPSSATQQLAEAVERSDVPARAWSPAVAGAGDEIINQPIPLPAPATSFVGRDLELGEVTNLLSRPDCRLLTLVGPGGVGKTRLALQSAQELARLFPSGSHFVALDCLSAPEAVPTAIANVLAMTLRGGDEPLSQVVRFIDQSERLLVLDNFEHLVEGAGMLTVLLARCPKLRLIVTSRVRLDLEGEWLLPLGGMAVPPVGLDTQDAEAYDTVRLFVERARRVQPSFSLTHTDVDAVLKICRLVQGYPLGLELAAVWVRVMPVAEIAQEIETCLDFLSTSSRNVSGRHQSIRATFEYSWGLLSKAEQEVLAKLSVFRGGFTREAASVVAGAKLVLLVALVDKSLLRVSTEGRYDFHPLVQEYAREKLADAADERTQVHTKHAEYFLTLGETAEPELTGTQQVTWLQRLDKELDNLRAALRWYQKAGPAENGLRLATSLWRFWESRGHFAEGRERLTAALRHPKVALEQNMARARGLKALGNLISYLADYGATQTAYKECLAIYRALGHEDGIATALHGLGTNANDRGDTEAAQAYFLESLAIARRMNNQKYVSDVLNNLGIVYTHRGDHKAAQSFYEEALQISREGGETYNVVPLLSNLGLIAWHLGDYNLAVEHLQESLALSKEVSMTSTILALSNLGIVTLDQGDLASALEFSKAALGRRWEQKDSWGLAYSLENIASIATVQGDPERAACLWGAAEALREVIGSPLPASWLPRQERFVAQARSQLYEASFTAAWERGRAMTLEHAVAYADDVGRRGA